MQKLLFLAVVCVMVAVVMSRPGGRGRGQERGTVSL